MAENKKMKWIGKFVGIVVGLFKNIISRLFATKMDYPTIVGVSTADLQFAGIATPNIQQNPAGTPQITPEPTTPEKQADIPETPKIVALNPFSDKFNKLVQFIFNREGRYYENNPADPGGETKWGISKKRYPNLDIKNLTEEKIKELYYKDYWLPLNCENYETKLALAIFDCGVNQGVGMAKQILTELHPAILTVETYLLKRLRHYFNLCVAKPNLKVFLIDWTLRIIKCSEFITK
jgi:hypothetical protein